MEPGADGVTSVLVANHARFLTFLEGRVGSRDLAEDILQAAFVKGIERQHALRDEESAVAWFYRLLRNAVIDHHRRTAAQERRQARHEQALAAEAAGREDPELERVVCACVDDLLPTLKPEYAGLLRRVDLEGVAVQEVARELGITPNNAGVRLHRARRALKQQLERACGTCTTHGCLDCRCQEGPAAEV